MEAAIRKDRAPGSDVERWMKEMRRIQIKRKRAETAPPPPKPAAAPKAPKAK